MHEAEMIERARAAIARREREQQQQLDTSARVFIVIVVLAIGWTLCVVFRGPIFRSMPPQVQPSTHAPR